MAKKVVINFTSCLAILLVSFCLATGVKAEATSTCPDGTKIYYYDSDGDSYGNSAMSVAACTAPKNYVATSTDCDDTKAAVNPGATEICNGIDDDCDGMIDEGLATSTFYFDYDQDGYGFTATSTIVCAAPSGYVATSSDCNDDNSLINPGKNEICDSLDNDCDGIIDENCNATATSTYYLDADRDGYGNATGSVVATSAPSGYVLNNKDCNDNNADIHPGAKELCDGIDNNCSGKVDENCSNNYIYPCRNWQLYRNHGAYVSCVAHWTNQLKKQNVICGKDKGQEMKKAAIKKFEDKWNKLWKDWQKKINKIEHKKGKNK